LICHFIVRSTEVGGLDGLDDRGAFVADNIHEIAPIPGAKIRMGENVFSRIHVLSVIARGAAARRWSSA